MLIHVPRSRVTKQLLQDAFMQELDAFGRIAMPASFSLAGGRLDEKAEWPAGNLFEEKAGTGPNRVDEENRTVSGTANVLEISRSGIKVHIDGMDVDHFNQNNPVVLACHCAVSDGLMPGAIGTIEKVTKAEGNTRLRFRNMRFDKDPIAEAWFQKVLSGTVRMTSIGFLPIEWEFVVEEQGKGKNKKEVMFINIPESELLEISVVPIGANRGAMIGQNTPYALLERVAAAEQESQKLREAVEVFLASEKASSAEAKRSRLFAAMDRVA